MKIFPIKKTSFLAFLCVGTIGCSVLNSSSKEVPEIVSGKVIDRDEAVGLQGVEVVVTVNERHFAGVGPEGTTKPRIKENFIGKTDLSGNFIIDLREGKKNLSMKYPGEKFLLEGIHFTKSGYASLGGDYKKPGVTYSMKKTNKKGSFEVIR